MTKTVRSKKQAGQSGHDGNKFFRNYRIEFRLTQDEYESLLNKVVDSKHKTVGAFVRQSLARIKCDGDTKSQQEIDLRHTLYLLSNATKNLNQIAKKANGQNGGYTGLCNDLQEVLEDFKQALVVHGKKALGR